MEKHFYIGEGPENDKLVREVAALIVQSKRARTKLAFDFGAAKVWTQGQKVCGLVYRKPQPQPWLNLVKILGRELVYRAQPDTPKGEALARRIQEEDILHFDPSRHILKTLRLHRSIVDAFGRMCESTANITNGKIYVSIPGGKEHTFPTIPSWLREVQNDEWLADTLGERRWKRAGYWLETA